ncbi:hypothetical protein BH20VER2_BH20VER2_17580 [soil metagenome]
MRSVELEIHDVAFGGNGVGRSEGKAIFVPFTIDGETVSARVVREKKQFAEAKLDKIFTPSPHRVEPECPYFGCCGGCSYQHISYEHQLTLKQRQVEQSLRRIGRIPEAPMRSMIPSPKSYGYRNRITVHAENGTVGYYRRDAHQLIDVERCPIAAPEVNRALAELRARRPRDGHHTLRSRSGPRVFEQTNDEVAAALAELIASLLPAGQELLIDAFCGAGFFTKRLREKFTRVVGIEWDRYAVAAAQETAAPNESYISGDVATELQLLLAEAPPQSTSVIVDPPATGLSGETRRALLDHPASTLAYVSCNPATLARDLQDLVSRFTLTSVTPLDMFPQTAEIEAVAVLTAPVR